MFNGLTYGNIKVHVKAIGWNGINLPEVERTKMGGRSLLKKGGSNHSRTIFYVAGTDKCD